MELINIKGRYNTLHIVEYKNGYDVTPCNIIEGRDAKFEVANTIFVEKKKNPNWEKLKKSEYINHWNEEMLGVLNDEYGFILELKDLM